MDRPSVTPRNTSFSSGPCAKPPGYTDFKDGNSVLGRSHRHASCKARINKCTADTLRILGCPEGYKAGIVPGSDTGAVEMIMWSLLGEREVDVFSYESFGSLWQKDINTLGLKHNWYKAGYGEIPDLTKANGNNDIIFPWNGTTSGARIPNGDWIPTEREGLVICDATSAVFSVDLPWDKLDITTFSWQKALGGEAAHGVIIFSPRALERIRAAKALRPLPKVLSILGKTVDDVCAGNVINTVSMMCVEDCNRCLEWVDSIGGLSGSIARTNANYQKVKDFVDAHDWIDFLCKDESCRSTTSVCVTLSEDGKPIAADKLKGILASIEKAGAGSDLGAYRDAPQGMRVWCGTTVDAVDVERMLMWLKHFYLSSAEPQPPLPSRSLFSSGPCVKPPTFDWFNDINGVLGRSHRHASCKARINKCTADTLRILGCPEGYKAGIVPGSDTGAVEMIMWSLLGEREVDVFSYESFGSLWQKDINTLGLKHNWYKAGYGEIPDLTKANGNNDIIFPWNGTTSGARIPNGDWIPTEREGLVICDATSAVFSVDLPWDKLDITTFSWQKALGGEAAHGVIIFSPRALERIRAAKALRPLPKVLSILGKTVDDVCAGNVINTVSMMCVEDCNRCLEWVDSIGGLSGSIARTNANYQKVKDFVDAHDWIDFLCKDESCRSTTSVCVTLSEDGKPIAADKLKGILASIEKAGAGSDLGAYREAPQGMRVWCGTTVDAVDVERMLMWLEVCHDVRRRSHTHTQHTQYFYTTA